MAAPALLTSPSYTEYYTAGSGSKSWSVSNLAEGRTYVEAYARDSIYADVYGTVAGLGLNNVGQSSSSGYDMGTILYNVGLSGLSGSNREFTTSYGEETYHVGVVLNSGVYVTSARGSVANGSSRTLTVNPNGYDCLAITNTISDDRSNAPSQVTVDNGATVSTVRVWNGPSTAYGFSGRVCSVEVLAADGSTVVTYPTNNGDRWCSVILIGNVPSSGGVRRHRVFLLS